MKQLLLIALSLIHLNLWAQDNGLVTVQSNHDVPTTADNLVNALESKGMNVFARIDHAQGAKKVEMELRPTELVIFGNPKVGTPLMLCQQSVAIDLPQKALIYEDDQGQTWLTYNDPAYLDQRHQLSECSKVLEKISGALANFANAATQ